MIPIEIVELKVMAWDPRFGKLMVLLFLVSTSTLVSSSEDDFSECENTVRNWAESSFDSGIKEDKLTLKDLLFFLHIPRTGGRTYFHCFLRKLYTNDQECPRSYDKFRFDPSKTNCRLLVTHDDYSIISKLPKEKTSVVTILRNPVDRVFSTYEFSIEVAARFLVHPNLTIASRMLPRIRSKSHAVSTLDIWPWKYLVPWMREDVFNRRDLRKLREGRDIKGTNSSYSMEDMVMPLDVYINDPIAHDIIHNGATFQVAGLTNNSNLGESHNVRHCVKKHPLLGRYVLAIAKNRLDHMLYVGLTEDHKNSATMFVNMVGAQVLSQSEALSSALKQLASSETDSEGEKSNQSMRSTNGEQRTVEGLMKNYEKCISDLRKSHEYRRNMSFKRIAPANFTKEARRLVPESVIQQILSLNSFDVELYKHAEDIFLLQKQHFMQKDRRATENHLLVEMENIRTNMYGFSNGKIFLLAVALLLIIILISFVVTAKRTSKLKV